MRVTVPRWGSKREAREFARREWSWVEKQLKQRARIEPAAPEPDVAFVRHEGLPPPAERISYLRVVPDLVVEIRSPNDAEAEVRAKLSLYLEVGVPLVWIVDPKRQTVEELRASASGLSDSRLMRAGAGDVLEGGELLPGFRVSLADIFE